MAVRIVDWDKEISYAKKDSAVGIKIATLLESNKEGTYITIIPVGAFITPHYHEKGEENYHILSGEGVIRLQPIHEVNKNFKLICKQVKAKNSFTIPEKIIHQLINTGQEPLTLIFSCPLSHLKEDRVLINTMEYKEIL